MTDEQRAERLRYHMYETNEGIREHAERIVALEELVGDILRFHETLRQPDSIEESVRLAVAQGELYARAHDLGVRV